MVLSHLKPDKSLLGGGSGGGGRPNKSSSIEFKWTMNGPESRTGIV